MHTGVYVNLSDYDDINSSFHGSAVIVVNDDLLIHGSEVSFTKLRDAANSAIAALAAMRALTVEITPVAVGGD